MVDIELDNIGEDRTEYNASIASVIDESVDTSMSDEAVESVHSRS